MRNGLLDVYGERINLWKQNNDNDHPLLITLEVDAKFVIATPCILLHSSTPY